MAEDLNIPNPIDINPTENSDVLDQSVSNTNSFNGVDLSNETKSIENLPGVVNFNNAYPDMSQFNAETFSDAVQLATEGLPNLENNQPYRDMIDNAAYKINFTVPVANNNLNDLFPGRAANDFDPFRTSSGIPDNNTRNGRKAAFASLQAETARMAPDKSPGYKDPYYYGLKKFNMDRYYRHPKFQDLGFHPFVDNESYYQANSSKWDNFTRTRGAFTDMYGPAFTSGWRSISQMFSGDILQADLVGAQSMEDAMRVGSSTSGGARGFFNDLFLNSAYTMGIITSIAAEEVALFTAAGAQGFLNPASDAALVARSAYNFGKVGKAVGRLLDVKQYGTYAANAMKQLKSIDAAKAFWAGARGSANAFGKGMGRIFTPESLYAFNKIKTSAKVGDNLTQMAKASTMFGGFYRDFRNVNMAWSESKMEGGLVELNLRDELYSEIKAAKDGTNPTQGELEMLSSDARAAGLTTTLINAPIIWLSNKLVLDGAMRGFRPIGKIMDNTMSGPLGRIMRNPKSIKKHFYDAGDKWIFGDNVRKMWNAGAKGSLKHLAGAGLRYSSMNFAEGFQELFQEATSVAVKTYYKGLYEQPLASDMEMQLAEMVDAYQGGIKSKYGDYDYTDRKRSETIISAAKKGLSSQMSGQGLHTFMSGFLMGGMIQGPQRLMFQTTPNLFVRGKDKFMGTDNYATHVKAKEDRIKRTVEVLNEVYQDSGNAFDQKKLNALLQKELNSEMLKASYENDITSFIDAKDTGMFNQIYTVLESGMLSEFRDQQKAFLKLDDIDLKAAFPNVSSTPQKMRARIEGILKNMDTVEKAYNKTNDEYVNPFDENKYNKAKEPQKHYEEKLRRYAFDQAKFMMMFSKDTFEKSLERANSIYNGLASDPVFANLAANDIAVLTSLKGLTFEINTLEIEIENEATTAEEKKIKKNKIAKLALLKEYFTVVTATENQATTDGMMYSDVIQQGDVMLKTESRNIGRFNKSKIGKLRPVFIKYINFLNESSSDIVLTKKEINEALKKIVDWNYLKGRATDYSKAFRVLSDPKHLLDVADRLSVIMKDVWEEHKKIGNITARVRKNLELKENIAFLDALSNPHEIVPDGDQTKLFLEDGTMPIDYYSPETKITQTSDPLKWQIIQEMQKDFRLLRASDKASSEAVDVSTTEVSNESVDIPGSTIEPDFDSMTANMEDKSKFNKYNDFVKEDKETEKILQDAHDLYTYEWGINGVGPYMEINEWSRDSKGGQGIIRARYELFQSYSELPLEERSEKSFEEWILSNQRNPLFVGSNGILSKHNVTMSDIVPSLAKDTGLKTDKLNKEKETVVSTDSDIGISVIKKTNASIDPKTGEFRTVYKLVNNNNEDIAEKYSVLDPSGNTLFPIYTTEATALNALKFLKKNLPRKSSFEFAGENFTTGDIVEDTNGSKWMIRSSKGMVVKNKNLYLVPTDKKNAKKGSDNRKYLTSDQWQKQGWNKITKSDTIDLGKNILTKITDYEPIKVFGFDQSKVGKGFKLYKEGVVSDPIAAQKEWQTFLRNLTDEDRNDLEFLVEKNPEYNIVQSEIALGNFRKYRVNKNTNPNPGLASGANEFNVTIMFKNKPVGVLMGSGVTILRDTDGSIIDGLAITQKQAERLFITKGDPNAAERIRRRYKIANDININISKALGSDNYKLINISELPGIKLEYSAGSLPYTTNKNATPWDELLHNNIDNEIWIYDIRTTWENDERIVKYSRLTNELDLLSLDEAVNINQRLKLREKTEQIDKQVSIALKKYLVNGQSSEDIRDTGLGRYVQVIKLPNGTVTFVELVANNIPTEQISAIAQIIKNQQAETLNKNFKDGKVINADFNTEFNNSLEDSFYFSMKPGENLNIGVSQFGDLSVRYMNHDTQTKESIILNLAAMLDIESGADFIEIINKEWSKNKNTKVKLNLKSENFVENIPNRAIASELTAVAKAKMRPEIRSNILANVESTNAIDMQAAENVSVNVSESSGGTVTQTTPNVTEAVPSVNLAQDVTQEDFNKLMDNNFENIDESILEIIRVKLRAGVDLMPIEEEVKNAYEALTEKDLIDPTEVVTEEVDDYLKVANKIKSKQNELVIKIQEFRKTELARLQSEQPNVNIGNLRGQVTRNLKTNEEINKINEEISDLEGDLDQAVDYIPFKIVDSFDNYFVEDIDKFIVFVKANLPDFIQVEDIDALASRLKNNGITAGAFVMELSKLTNGMDITGKIYTGKQNPFKYHEAFHGVFRMLLSEKEIKKYLTLAKTEKLAALRKENKTLDQALKELKSQSPTYSRMSRKELEDTLYEEYLADEFEKFKTNPRSTGVAAGIKNFFTRLIEMLKSVFLTYSKNDIELLFNQINSGKYRLSGLASNRFTDGLYESMFFNRMFSVGVSNTAWSIRKGSQLDRRGDGSQIVLNKYFTVPEEKAIISTIAGNYLTKLKETTGEYNPKELLDASVSEFVEMWNPERGIDALGNGGFFTEQSNYDNFIDGLIERYEALTFAYLNDDIGKSAEDYLKLFDETIQDEILERVDIDEYGQVKTTDQYDASANEIGGWLSLSTGVRKFLGTTTIIMEDRFGVQYSQPVDVAQGYQGLLKTMSGTTNVNTMISKMQQFANTSVHSKAIIQRLFNEVGLEKLNKDNLVSTDYNLENDVANSLLFQSIIKAFTQFRIDYTFIETDQKTGVVNLYAANHKDDASIQSDQWSAAYGTKFIGLSKDPELRRSASNTAKDLKTIFQKSKISDNVLFRELTYISNELTNKLGISLSVGYLKYSVLNNMDVANLTAEQLLYRQSWREAEGNAMTLDDAAQLEDQINDHGITKDGAFKVNLFANIDDTVITDEKTEDSDIIGDLGSIKGRIKRMARGNATFDERVGNSVFRDPEGNLIYAHQMPTFNLEKVAELNSEDAIDALKGDDKYLESNMLLNDPKFIQLARDGKLRIQRVIGSKQVELVVDDITGERKSKNTLDLTNKRATKFGSSTPTEFLATLMNTYLFEYDASTGGYKGNSYDAKLESGEVVKNTKFASALTSLRVMAEASTNDFIALPIFKSVEKINNEDKITSDYIDKTLSEIENEYVRGLREVEGFTKEEVLGYNIPDKNGRTRAFELFKTGNLLTNYTKPLINKTEIEFKTLDRSNNVNEDVAILKGNVRVLLGSTTRFNKTGLDKGKSAVINIKKVPFLLINRGLQTIEEFGFENLKEKLGTDITIGSKGGNKYKTNSINNQVYYVATAGQRDFINNKKALNIFELEKVTSESMQLEEDGSVAIYDVDASIKELFEQKLKDGIDFKTAIEEVEKEKNISVKDLIEKSLEREFAEFQFILTESGANKLIDSQLSTQLQTIEGKTKPAEDAMTAYNLIPNDIEFNYKQVFLSDYINTRSMNQVLLGDAATRYKDTVDEIKRAKMQNASGPSAQSVIASKKHGIIHPVKNISLITFNDPKFITKYSKNPTGDKADAQMWITTKAFRYMMFGFGRLSEAQSKILDKIEAGETITSDEYFGSFENKTKGFKSQDGTINSKKLVYADGKTFLKMSAFTLTKRYTSDPKTNFETALPGREKEHNLRLKLERLEVDGNETLGIAVPVTASKMFKSNIISEDEAFGKKGEDFNAYTNPDNVTTLDARWMRLQQINPSGKIEIVDPTQIKQLITSEQSDDVEVTINGKEMSIGDVRKLYNKSVGDRVTTNFLLKRNLVFTYKNALDALEESVNIDSMTPDLEAFLNYAMKGLESSQARGQFLELFETDKNGVQKYNLNNPITERKFSELFLSYFSKGVFREYQPGHSVTLKADINRVIKKVTRLDENGQPIEWDVIRMDDYINLTNRPDIKDLEYADPKKKTFANDALSVGDVYLDDLRYNIMEYKNGVATGERYSEFMLPPHFAEVMQNLKPGQPIPEVIAKAFATRIPSQDKHSAINLKLVDFLPVEYGSTGIFPEELIEVSGADFDIDKLTMQIKEFYVENGEFIEYGKSNDVNVQYDEYINYQIKQSGKGGSSMNDAVSIWNSRGRELYPELEEDLKAPSDVIVGALTILGLPRNIKEFEAYKEKYKKVIGGQTIYRYPYQAVNNNVILDARYALLGNEGVSGPLFGRPNGIAQEPATLDALEDVWTFIQNELPELANETKEEGVDIDNLNGKYKSFKNNVEGGRSIGAVVKPNIYLNLLRENKVSIRQKNINGNLPQIFIDNAYNTFDINYQKNIDGSPIDKATAVRNQDVLSSEITATTDNAKERLLAKLGLNKDALAVTANLVALGMPIKTAILLVNQPEIKDAYHKVDVQEDVFLKSEIKNKITLLSQQYGNEVEENSYAINVTTSNLIDQIKNKNEEKTKNDITIKIAILNQFLNAYELKQATGKLGSLTDLTSGLGSDSESLDRKQRDIIELGIELNNVEFNNLSIPIDVRNIFKQSDSFIKTYYNRFKDFNNFLPKILISRSEGFKKMTSLILDNLDINSSIETQVKVETERNILSYLTGKAYIQHLKNSNQVRKLDSLQNGMIYDKYSDGQITISDTVINIKNHLASENKDNYFMDLFLFNTTTKNPTNKSGINEARMNTWTSLNDSQVIDMQTSLLELLGDPFTNREVKDLVHYLLVKDGLQYSPNSFLPIIPAPLLDEILSPLDRVQSTLASSESSNENYKKTFGLTLSELGEDLITGYLQSRKLAYYLPSMKTGTGDFLKRTKPTIINESTETKVKVDLSKGKGSVVENVKEGTLTVDKYALARSKPFVKGRGRRKDTSGYKKGKLIASNIKFAGTRGFKTVDVPVNTRAFKGNVELFKFSNVIYYVTGTKNKKYHFFQLQQVFSPSFGSETNNLYDLNGNETSPIGTKAIYKRIKMLGSMSQNPTGFIYDTATIKRTPYDELPSQIEANNLADQESVPNFDQVTKDINKGNKVDLKDLVGADMSIVATENSMTIIDNSTEKEVDLQMLERMSKTNELDFSTINTDNANAVVMPEGGFNKLDAMSQESSTPGEYKLVLDFYEDLNGIEKSNIFDVLGIKNTSDLIDNLEMTQFTEEEYIEQLKKCYK